MNLSEVFPKLKCDGPESSHIRIIRLEHAVHDSPVNVGRGSIEGDVQLFTDAARSTITSNKILCLYLLLTAGSSVAYYSLDWIFALRILNLKTLNN